MNKTITICAAFFLLTVGQPTNTKATVAPSLSSNVLTEVLFIPIARDFALLDSWLSEQELPKEALEALRNQSHQEILTFHEIDHKTWTESMHYYLEDSIERALPVYEKIHAAVAMLLETS